MTKMSATAYRGSVRWMDAHASEVSTAVPVKPSQVDDMGCRNVLLAYRVLAVLRPESRVKQTEVRAPAPT